MLKHARNGIPLEVIGVMLGGRVDEFTIEVIDVYATPQVATGQNVETTDERFQVKMAALLEQIGYNDVMVGWYHSHPGFDVWFSEVDASNQDAMEHQDQRAVGIVVDPVLSVRGKVVIGAFRNVPGWKERRLAAGKVRREDPREKTSFVGETVQPSATTKHQGLNLRYYMLPIVYNLNEHEKGMLESLHRPSWCAGFDIPNFTKNHTKRIELLKTMKETAGKYRLSILEEHGLSQTALEIRHVGKVDPQRFLRENSDSLGNHHASLLARLHVTEESF